jgi:hypothetical protein
LITIPPAAPGGHAGTDHPGCGLLQKIPSAQTKFIAHLSSLRISAFLSARIGSLNNTIAAEFGFLMLVISITIFYEVRPMT